MMEDTRLDEKVETTDSGDHDTFSHYANLRQIEDAMLNGIPLVALCGKKWLPSKDFTKYKVCPTCQEIYEQLEPQ